MPRPSDPCKRNCCWSYGICSTRGGCQHHRDAQWEQDLYDLVQADRDYLRYSSDATKVRAR